MNPTTAGESSVRPVDHSAEGALSVVDPRSGLTASLRQAELSIPATTSVPISAPAVAIDAKAVLASVRRRWFLALSLGLFAGGVAAAIAWFAIPDSYVAFAELRLHESQKRVMFVDVADRGFKFNVYRQSQMRVLTNPLVLQAAMRKPDIAACNLLKDEPRPLEWLEHNISVSTPATEFIRISLKGPAPGDLAPIVNAITSAYLDEINDIEHGDLKTRRHELEKARDDLAAKRKAKSAKYKRVATEAGATSEVAVQHTELAMAEFYSKLRTRLADAKFEHSRIEWQLKRRKAGHAAAGEAPKEIPQDVLESRILQEPAVMKAQQEADRLEQAAAALRIAIADPKKPKRVAAEEALARAQNDVEIAKSKARESVAKKLREELTKFSEADIASLEDHVKHSGEEIDDLNRQLAHQSQTRKAAALQSLELMSLQKELEQDERIERQIIEELMKLDIEFNPNREGRVEIFRPAQIPHSPDMSKKIRIVGASGGGALALIVAGIIWLDLRTRRINTLEEVAGGLRLPVLGLLPTVPKRIAASHDPNAAAGAQGVWQGTLMESVDAARVMLLRRAQLEKAKVAMVVSAVASEGKTTLACHLATSLARSGHKTLLVDADMRRPTVHRVFELPNEPGLCELLRRESELADVVIPTAQDGLYLVPAGQLSHEALRELAQDGLGKLVQQMREEYDFVIFDSSPILPVTDSLMLSKHIDGSIVSIRRDVSQYPKVASACQRLAAMGVPIWGAVVIGLGHPAYGYRYAYTYGTPAKK